MGDDRGEEAGARMASIPDSRGRVLQTPKSQIREQSEGWGRGSGLDKK